MTQTLSDFSATRINGQHQALSDYAGDLVLVVNVASQCGLTPQYEGLEALYRQFKDQGLVILGFPCNQFAGQEPGSSAEISQFCTLNFGVSFPLFERIEVNGEDAHPLYDWLKASAPGVLGSEAIKWNFTKFLVGRDGQVIQRYAPTTEPAEIGAEIATLI